MERELTVRHVFVGFVEGKYLESGMRNSQPFQRHLLGHIVYFILSLLAETQFALQ